ncbi:unnamed protein product [Lymnaea stagnalis]|uniref:Carbohydrate kinase PfkB domain-containing protein n=1 Tax=Lymnaea stagnalis TaxID=6523 RepID=A0AAV2IDC9_LYMST
MATYLSRHIGRKFNIAKSTEKCCLYTPHSSRSSINNKSTFHSKSFQSDFLQISEEVREALHTKKPVVALESTIITHGMPYPHNFSTALSVEKKVRDNGAVPATVAVMRGKLCVGVCDTDIIWLAEKNSSLVKVSRRDLPYLLSQGLSGGTTVSATMMASHMAGIQVFATGGVGGVHRGAENSFDISADLTELGRTPVSVISSGVKSILDIPKTLEYLETQGTCVMTFGKDRNFPAFFSPESGYQAPYNIISHLEAAQVIGLWLNFLGPLLAGLESGILIAVPIPPEFAATGELIQNAINEALRLASVNNVTGKEVTPYLLNMVNQLTKGESLMANIALIENNASVAGGIASCLAQLRSGVPLDKIVTPPQSTSCSLLSSPTLKSALTDSSIKLRQTVEKQNVKTTKNVEEGRNKTLLGRPVVIGSTVVDFSVQVDDPNFQLNGGTYSGKVSESFGGVGRNLADCLSRLAFKPVFISAVGNDSHSMAMSSFCSHMDLSSIQKIDNMTTATCCVLLSKGKFLLGVGDMGVNSKLTLDQVKNFDSLIESAPVAMLDGNFSSTFIATVVDKCARFNVPVWFEPTDLYKSKTPFETDAWKQLSFISPNLGELLSMYQALRAKLGQEETTVSLCEESSSQQEIIDTSITICRELVAHIPVVLLTLGRHGVLLCHNLGDVKHFLPLPSSMKSDKSTSFKAMFYPAFSKDIDPSKIVSVSGAGDCLAATVVASMLDGQPIDQCIKHGLLAAYISLLTPSAVPDNISRSGILEQEKLLMKVSWSPADVTNGFTKC